MKKRNRSALPLQAVAREVPRLAAEWTKVTLGLSDIAVPETDPQFADPSWREHGLYRRLAQGYLAWSGSMERLVPDEAEDWQAAGRGRYWTDIVTGAMSPANFALTNPAGVKRAIDTGGLSLLRGARNLATDVVRNGGLPSMVDSSPFTVGENLGCTPGAVVHREEMFELLHYRPTTETIHERPLLFVPPQVNRYYVLDLAPGRSLIEYAVSRGQETFAISWRNPSRDPAAGHGRWGLDDYVAATQRAFQVVMGVTGSPDLNLLGFCAGGMTAALAQAELEANGGSPVHSATYLVTLLDARRPNLITPLCAGAAARDIDARAASGEVVDALTLAHGFAWLRPKDLVFGNLVRSWVMGESPGPFDLLAWNDDAAHMSATFIRDSLALLTSGDLLEPGAAAVLGTGIDLGALKADNFIVTAQNDHLTTWRPCYMTSQLLGGDSEMVLIDKGHIQAVVSPVPNSRHSFWAGPAGGPDPDAWQAGAERFQGSWWPRWGDWLEHRSGARKPPPEALGSSEYPATDAAPGRYVHEG